MAISFNAETDRYVRTTNLPSSGWTVTMWIYRTGDRDDSSPIIEFKAGNFTGVWITTQANGTTVGIERDGTGNVGALATSLNTWYRIAMTVNGTSVAFFSGGATGALTKATGTLSGITTAPTTMYLGGDEYISTPGPGRIAAVKISDSVLSDADIELELGQYMPLNPMNGCYPFLGADLLDFSPNKRNWTAGSTAVDAAEGPPLPWDNTVSQYTVSYSVGTEYPVSTGMSATAALSTTGKETAVTSVSMTGVAALSAGSKETNVASTTLNAIAALTSTGYPERMLGVSLGATAGLSVSAMEILLGALNLSSVADLEVNGSSQRLAMLTLNAVANLGVATREELSAGAHLTAISSLVSAGYTENQAIALLDTVALLSVEGHEELASVVTAQALSELSLAGDLVEQSMAVLDAVADLTVGDLRETIALVDMVGIPSLNVAALMVEFGATDLNAVAQVIVDALTAVRPAGGVLTAVASLQIAAYQDRLDQVALSTAATLGVGETDAESFSAVSLLVTPLLSVGIDRVAAVSALGSVVAALGAGSSRETFATTLLEAVAQLSVEQNGSASAVATLNAMAHLDSAGTEDLLSGAFLAAIASLTDGGYAVRGAGVEAQADIVLGVNAGEFSGSSVTMDVLGALLLTGTGYRTAIVDAGVIAELTVSGGLTHRAMVALLSAYPELSTDSDGDIVASILMETIAGLSLPATREVGGLAVLDAVASFLVDTSKANPGSASMETDTELFINELSQKVVAASLASNSTLYVDSRLTELAATNLIAEALLATGGGRNVDVMAAMIALSTLIAQVADVALSLPLSVRGPLLQEVFRSRIVLPGRMADGSYVTERFTSKKHNEPPF